MSSPVRVLFADDHPILQLAIERILGRKAEVLSVVTTLRELDTVIQSDLQFDLLLLDLLFGASSSLPRIKTYLKRRPDLRVLVLSGYDNPEVCRQALRAGAHGFVSKLSALEQLPSAVSVVGKGGRWLGDPALSLPKDENASHSILGEKTANVLRLLVTGLSYQEVAELLGVSPKAIGHHARRIRKHMGIHGTRHQDWRQMFHLFSDEAPAGEGMNDH